jgi:hypothetical protein
VDRIEAHASLWRRIDLPDASEIKNSAGFTTIPTSSRIGYCSTERPCDCILSIAASANGVGLSFYHGSPLPDPHRFLLGSGSQNRFIRIESPAMLTRPEVEELIAVAIKQAEGPLLGSDRGKLIIRSNPVLGHFSQCRSSGLRCKGTELYSCDHSGCHSFSLSHLKREVH